MYIEQRELHGATVLDCCGRFDEMDQELFMKAIEKLHGNGCRHLVINFTSLYFLDPQVISLLHLANEHFQSSSGVLSLVSPLGFVRTELSRFNIHETIPTYTTVYDALHRPHATIH